MNLKSLSASIIRIFRQYVLQIMIERKEERERKKRGLEPTQNNVAFGRKLRGDSVNFSMSYSHRLVCTGKRGQPGVLVTSSKSRQALQRPWPQLRPAKSQASAAIASAFFFFLLAAWLWSFSLSSCYSPIVEAQAGNPPQQICRGVPQCRWRSASRRTGKQRGAAIQKCFANLGKRLNFPSFVSQPFLSPEVWQAVLTGPSFLCTQHTPTLKILLKRKNLLIIKCLGKWLLLNTSEGAIHSATIHNNITCCTASEILEIFLLQRGRNER